VAFLVALAPQVITVLFTGRYLASVPVFQLWTCSLVLAVPCVDAVLRACADTRFLLGLNLLRLLMVVLLITWCLDRFGLPGAVLVMLISTAATRALAVVRICRLTGATAAAVLPWRALATTTLCALAAAVPALAFARAFPLPAFASLIGAAVIYAVVYAGLSLRLLAGASAGPVLPALQNAR
jgi:O-antigen/teichoic acid export membrane protein